MKKRPGMENVRNIKIRYDVGPKTYVHLHPLAAIKGQSRHTKGDTIAQWVHLRLPSCRPGFESKSHHLCFYQSILICVGWKKRK